MVWPSGTRALAEGTGVADAGAWLTSSDGASPDPARPSIARSASISSSSAAVSDGSEPSMSPISPSTRSAARSSNGSTPSVVAASPTSGISPGTSSAAATNAPDATTTASTAVAPASTVRPGRRASVGNPVRNGSSTNRQLSHAAPTAKATSTARISGGGSASRAISGRTSAGQCQR